MGGELNKGGHIISPPQKKHRAGSAAPFNWTLSIMPRLPEATPEPIVLSHVGVIVIPFWTAVEDKPIR